jgi:hypothetical protein
MQQPVRIEIDDGHRVASKLGHKQTIALEIDRQMIDAAANVAKRDFPFKQERRLAPGLIDEQRAHYCKHHRKEPHGIALFPFFAGLTCSCSFSGGRPV